MSQPRMRASARAFSFNFADASAELAIQSLRSGKGNRLPIWCTALFGGIGQQPRVFHGIASRTAAQPIVRIGALFHYLHACGRMKAAIISGVGGAINRRRA